MAYLHKQDVEEPKPMLSPQVREGLEAEIQHLTLQRQRIDAQIRAIQAVLKPDGLDEQRSLPMSGGPLSGLGLRESMKTVLTSYPGGLRPMELVQRMQEMGFQTTGKLPLRTRVYSELGRLRNKEHRVTKRGKRFVWLEKGSEQEAAGNG